MSVVTMKQLLETGAHFGHQTYKWNPKMDKYIFIKRNGIHILDLKQTVDSVNEAYMFIKDIVSKGKSVLFVGTKKQAQDSLYEAAKKSGAFYVSNRWYGGMLTNMQTIRKSIAKLDEYERMVEDGTMTSFTKLEATKMKREYDKILSSLGGIREMDTLPGAVFVVDIIKEKIAVHEANKLGIPVVAMVDTNADPDNVDYVIPSNDDAIRAIGLMCDIMSQAVIDGKQGLLEGEDVVKPEKKETKEQKKSKKTSKESAKKDEKKTEKKTDKKADKKKSKPKKKTTSKKKEVKKAKDKKEEDKKKKSTKKAKTSKKSTKEKDKKKDKKTKKKTVKKKSKSKKKTTSKKKEVKKAKDKKEEDKKKKSTKKAKTSKKSAKEKDKKKDKKTKKKTVKKKSKSKKK